MGGGPFTGYDPNSPNTPPEGWGTRPTPPEDVRPEDWETGGETEGAPRPPTDPFGNPLDDPYPTQPGGQHTSPKQPGVNFDPFANQSAMPPKASGLQALNNQAQGMPDRSAMQRQFDFESKKYNQMRYGEGGSPTKQGRNFRQFSPEALAEQKSLMDNAQQKLSGANTQGAFTPSQFNPSVGRNSLPSAQQQMQQNQQNMSRYNDMMGARNAARSSSPSTLDRKLMNYQPSAQGKWNRPSDKARWNQLQGMKKPPTLGGLANKAKGRGMMTGMQKPLTYG
tara:strand:- start:359 stop:1198 length:840 start_codon:yes stop_codon:yes gene_type:complete